MDKTVKVFLTKLDSIVEVRRFPMNIGTPHNTMNGQFGLLIARIGSSFPSLRGKTFDLAWKDTDGDLILMSSDEELGEAFAASTSPTLKVYITESSVMQNESGQNARGNPPVVPTAPPQPFYDYVASGHYHGAPYSPAAPVMPPPGYPVLPPPQAGVVPMMHGNHGNPQMMAAGPCGPAQIDSSRPGHGEKKAWKTALRAQVPAPHRRWAKTYIRQWRRANVGDATTSTSSDSERGPKLTREEAGVPYTYQQWLDMILPKMHMSWSRAGKDFSLDIPKELQASVPAEFQTWCHWYLKRHFGPKSKKEFKAEGKDKSCGGNKDWKAMKRETRKSVPRHYRIWTRTFIKQWQEDHLYSKDNNMTSSSSSSGTETGSDAEITAREAILEEIIIPADYPRWLRKFLTWKYTSIGVTLRTPDQSVADWKEEQFKDTVPKEYRKWVRSFLNHRLNKGKKHCKKNSQELPAQPTDNYQKWLSAFQKRWVEQVGGRQAMAIHREVSVHPEAVNWRSHGQPFDMGQLREDIDSSDSEEENEGTPQRQRIPHEFRRWARHALNQWDGMTLPPTAHQQHLSGQDEVPPRVMNWMIRVMTKSQKRRMKAQMRAEKQEIKMHRREAKAERKAAKAGFKAARRSLKIARQVIRYRYV